MQEPFLKHSNPRWFLMEVPFLPKKNGSVKNGVRTVGYVPFKYHHFPPSRNFQPPPYLGRTLSTKVALGRGRPWGKHYRKRERGSHPGTNEGPKVGFVGNFERNESKKSGRFPLLRSSLKSSKANDASEWQPHNFLNIKP